MLLKDFGTALDTYTGSNKNKTTKKMTKLINIQYSLETALDLKTKMGNIDNNV